jgi:hypothetical protein
MRSNRTLLLAVGCALAACKSNSTGPAGSRIRVTSGAAQTGHADSTLPVALTVLLSGTRQLKHRAILYGPTADTTLVHNPLPAGTCGVLVERFDGQGGKRCSAVDSTDGSGQAWIVLSLGPTPGPAHLVVTLLNPYVADTVSFTVLP